MIIAVTGFKGGVGKTSISVNLAACLEELGHTVLIVDADIQGSASEYADVARGSFPTVVSMTKPILHKAEQVPRLAKSVDFVIIDCPPKEGEVIRSALVAADFAIVPITPSALDTLAMAKFKKLLEEALQVRDMAKLPILTTVLLVSKKKAGTLAGDEAKGMLTFWKMDVLDTEIGERMAVQYAVSEGKTVIQYEPESKAAQEFRQLAKEVVRYAEARKDAHTIHRGSNEQR